MTADDEGVVLPDGCVDEALVFPEVCVMDGVTEGGSDGVIDGGSEGGFDDPDVTGTLEFVNGPPVLDVGTTLEDVELSVYVELSPIYPGHAATTLISLIKASSRRTYQLQL